MLASLGEKLLAPTCPLTFFAEVVMWAETKQTVVKDLSERLSAGQSVAAWNTMVILKTLLGPQSLSFSQEL